ncbi:hypothetical protein PS1_008560 [Malus domestica]
MEVKDQRGNWSGEEICRWGDGGASSSERCRLAMVVFVVDGPAIPIADELAAESTESEAQEWPDASTVTQPRQLLLPQQRPPVPHLHPSSRQFLPPRTHPPSIFRNPNMRLNLDWAQNPRSVRDELIERQLEKEIIREEIIAAEIARRWALEAEVKRELMLEREIAMRRPAGEGLGCDQDRFGAMRLDHRVDHPFDDDRFGFFASRAPAAFDSFTWRRQQEPLTNGFNSTPSPSPPSSSSTMAAAQVLQLLCMLQLSSSLLRSLQIPHPIVKLYTKKYILKNGMVKQSGDGTA